MCIKSICLQLLLQKSHTESLLCFFPIHYKDTIFNWLGNTIKQKISCQWGIQWCILFGWHFFLKQFKAENTKILLSFSIGGRNILFFFSFFLFVLSVNSDLKVNVFHKILLVIFFPRPCNHFFRLYFFLIDLLSFPPKAFFLFFSISFEI